jgi:hypothetical protein
VLKVKQVKVVEEVRAKAVKGIRIKATKADLRLLRRHSLANLTRNRTYPKALRMQR